MTDCPVILDIDRAFLNSRRSFMQNKYISIVLATFTAMMLFPPLASAGFDGYEVVTEETSVDSTPTKQLIVNCPVGKYALGAGWAAVDKHDTNLDGQVLYALPAYDGSGWTFNVENISSYEANWKLRVSVTCATVTAS
jgi:hypothetical protein